jgi:hypothetical protein
MVSDAVKLGYSKIPGEITWKIPWVKIILTQIYQIMSNMFSAMKTAMGSLPFLDQAMYLRL